MEECKKIAKTESIVFYNHKYYFVPMDGNYLYEMSEDYSYIKALIRLDEKITKNLYYGIEVYDGRLFFIPKCAEKIAIYDINNKCMEYVCFREKNHKEILYNTFSGVVDNNSDYLYFIPAYYNSIVKINKKDFSVSKKEIGDIDLISYGNAVLVNNKIWIPAMRLKNIIVYDCDSEEVTTLLEVPLENEYSFIMNGAEYIILIPNDLSHPILKYSYDGHRIGSFNDEISDIPIVSFKAYEKDNELYLITDQVGWIVKISMDGKKILLPVNELVDISEDLKWYEKYLRQICLVSNGKDIFTINGYSSEWYRFDGMGWKQETLTEKVDYVDCIRLDYSILSLI